jgi:hypothetical protein
MSKLTFCSEKSIQFYVYLQKWYQKRRKVLSKQVKLTPTSILVWLMDDGSYKGNRVILNTQCFTHEENNRLASHLSKIIRIEVRVKEYHDKQYEKTYFFLEITHKKNLRKLMSYINKADH